jgi:hypothetical protein
VGVLGAVHSSRNADIVGWNRLRTSVSHLKERAAGEHGGGHQCETEERERAERHVREVRG